MIHNTETPKITITTEPKKITITPIKGQKRLTPNMLPFPGNPQTKTSNKEPIKKPFKEPSKET